MENVIDFPSDGHSNIVIADLPMLYPFLLDHGRIAWFLDGCSCPSLLDRLPAPQRPSELAHK